MIHRSTRSEIDSYFNDPRVSQSKLKLLMSGVEAFTSVSTEEEAELFYEGEKTHFIIGSATDCRLMQENSDFDHIYHVSDIIKPSDKIMSIVQQTLDTQLRMSGGEATGHPRMLNEIEDYLWDAIEAHAYYPKWTKEVKVNKVKTEGQLYYESLLDALGKQVLSLDEFATIQCIENSVRNNSEVGFYFQDNDNFDIYYQLPIYFTYAGVEYKALIDILIIDHANRTIQVIDFKTLGDYTIQFHKAVRKRRYDFQVAFYTIAAEKWRLAKPELSAYTVTNPGFIVETTLAGKQGNPLFFACSNQMMNLAAHGATLYNVAKFNNNTITDNVDFDMEPAMPVQKIYGINEIVNLHKWHLEHGFEKDKVVIESKNNLVLNWEGIDYEDSVR